MKLDYLYVSIGLLIKNNLIHLLSTLVNIIMLILHKYTHYYPFKEHTILIHDNKVMTNFSDI